MSAVASDARSRASRAQTAWALVGGVGLVYAASATWTGSASIDVQTTALEAWQWATSGQPWLDDLNLRWESENGALPPSGQLVEGREGLVTSRTPGVVLAAVPAYLIAGSDSAILAPSTAVAVLLTTMAVAAMFLALDTLTRRPVAIGATLAFALASPTWSVSADALWTHSLTQVGIAGAALASSRGRWWLAGAALGIAILGRSHMAIVALVLGLGVAFAYRRPCVAVQVGIPSIAAVAMTLAVNRYRYGSASLAGGYDYATGSLTSASSNEWLEYVRNVAGFLVSADRGFLLWSTVVILLVPACIRASRTAPAWVLALAVGGFAYTAIQLKINSFAGGDSFFGYRHGLELLTCLMPLLALSWAQVRHEVTRVAIIVLLFLQAAVVATGAFVDGLWVPASDVWSSSSIVLAADRAPAVLIAFTTLAMIGAVFTVRILGSEPVGGSAAASSP